MVDVIADSPASAANWIKDRLLEIGVDHPVEIDAFGSKGGAVGRFIGWETLVGAQIFRDRPGWVQLDLFPGRCPRRSTLDPKEAKEPAEENAGA